MNIRFRLAMMSLGMLIGGSFASPSSFADESATRLVTTAAQDEARKLPDDNVAYFTRADRRVRFQLVKFSGTSSELLAGTKVNVVDPAGVASTIVADEKGVATLENPVPGLYAVAATDELGHVAMPFAVREGQTEAADNAADTASAAPAKLALMDIDPKEVLRFTSSYVPPEVTESPLTDIDTDFVISADTVQGLQYRVRLGDEGTLDGQVYSLAQNGLSTYAVGGTTISIFKGNRLVARTVADDLGRFKVDAMKPGVYGLFAGGPAGYAGFGFEAYNAEAVAANSTHGETLVSTKSADLQLTTTALAPGSTLPVVLIPPSMLPSVLDSIRNAAGIAGPDGLTGGPGFGPSGIPGGAPGVGGVAGVGPGGGFGGGAVGAAGGLGGLGGLLAAGGLAAGIAAANNDDNANQNVEFVSP